MPHEEARRTPARRAARGLQPRHAKWSRKRERGGSCSPRILDQNRVRQRALVDFRGALLCGFMLWHVSCSCSLCGAPIPRQRQSYLEQKRPRPPRQWRAPPGRRRLTEIFGEAQVGVRDSAPRSSAGPDSPSQIWSAATLQVERDRGDCPAAEPAGEPPPSRPHWTPRPRLQSAAPAAVGQARAPSPDTPRLCAKITAAVNCSLWRATCQCYGQNEQALLDTVA